MQFDGLRAEKGREVVQKSPFWGILTGCLTGVLLGLAFVAQFGWPWASLALAAIVGAVVGWIAYDWQSACVAFVRAVKETMVGMPEEMQRIKVYLTLSVWMTLLSFFFNLYMTSALWLFDNLANTLPGAIALGAFLAPVFGFLLSAMELWPFDDLPTRRFIVALYRKALLKYLNPIAVAYWGGRALLWLIKALAKSLTHTLSACAEDLRELLAHPTLILRDLLQLFSAFTRTILLFVKYTNEEGRRAAALATLFSLSIAMAVGAWLNENLVAYALVGLVLGPVVGHIEHKVYRALERRGRIEWALAKLGTNKAD
ncbi:hypothetical protein IPJ70_03205 [Candidatus Campbellbacteria bacterium]|nr:MAG: hypothetical protein IPJ70_03205 [Candidatus Campbellbacteria bacterium]